jgi:hypothetical protein
VTPPEAARQRQFWAKRDIANISPNDRRARISPFGALTKQRRDVAEGSLSHLPEVFSIKDANRPISGFEVV